MGEERTRGDFDHLVKDALNSLYDYAALALHPLGSLLDNTGTEGNCRSHRLHDLLIQAIETLRPPAGTLPEDAMAWRPYRVLRGRYIERASLKELQEDLALSPRQLRREHARSIEAVATMLGERLLNEAAAEVDERTLPEQATDQGLRTYDLRPEMLDLTEVIESVVHILQPRVEDEGASLRLLSPPESHPVYADRIILRQILFSLVNRALQVQTGTEILIQAEMGYDDVKLVLEFHTDEAQVPNESKMTSATARYWTERLGAEINEDQKQTNAGMIVRTTLSIPRGQQTTVLVVDDQQATIRMFRRYLSRFNIQVVGIRESESVVDAAHNLQPQCITLDLMMPSVDGWEILQALQSDPETQHIPIIVCSVWNEPQLAFSLGATAYLRKPVTQNDLLMVLEQLEILDIPDVVSPVDT